MKKKALAIVLALCMVISMLPVTVFAAQPQAAPAPGSGPEIVYRPMSDVQPMANVEIQPMFAVGDNELIIQYTEGGTVYYDVENDYSATFWAFPDEGYYVESILIEYTENLSVPEVNYLGFNEFIVYMARCDVRVTVFFEKVVGKAHTIKVVADDHGTYTVTRTTAHAGEFFHVETFPDQYYNEFCRLVTKNGKEIDYIAQGDLPNCYSYIMPDSDVTLYVEFDRYGPYSLSVKPFNAGGTISVPVEKAYYGEIVPITVIPDPGMKVHYIDISGFGKDTSSIAYAGNNIWNLTMGNDSVRILISFAENINPITVNAGPGGTASANVTQAKVGDTVTLTCTPDEGYRVESITGVDGLVDNGDGTYTFTMPEKAVTINVTFKNVYNPITLTVETGIGGTASVDVTEAKEGDTVTLTCAPEEGYRVARIAGVDGLTDNGDGTYTFTMPDEAVDIKVLFLRNENPFLDVNETHYFYESVLWAAENGVTDGISATAFDPGAACIRAQVVTFLWRYAGSPEPTTTENPFTDVPDEAWFTKAVLWAVENGITNGVSGDMFGPGLTCNRAEVVTFLWRFMGQPESQLDGHTFVDVASGSWYEQSVLWALENGITNGTDATHFAPGGQCIRAQVVTFLYRTAQLPVFYDITCDFNADQGSVTLSHDAAQAGETVTATVIPAEGWQIESVACRNGTEVTQVSDSEFTFVMPEADVVLEVLFSEIPVEPSEPDPSEPTDPTEPTRPGQTFELDLRDNGNGRTAYVDGKMTAAPGESIFFYAVPNEGYYLDHVGIFNPDGLIDVRALQIHDHGNGLYELIMIPHDLIMTCYFYPIN